MSLRRPSIVVNLPPRVPICVSKSNSGIDTLLVSLLRKEKKKGLTKMYYKGNNY